ncbi:hypothetical protein [Flagellimonas flava]|uniref:Uncharacterized protein n=1 Tax=Flagellimonas flava TaxID=570519 RepID=A0A1M5JYL5_9FLAO|nr:hypothetical protein [Allomuricauda flava]SHG45687.1 hypothetical protein SAMN04488116_1293 [Allomuricauda flava]
MKTHKQSLLVSALCISISLFGQQNNFEKEMEAALQLHVEAKTFEGEKAAEKAFSNIGQDYNNWLAYFWGAYINTQLVNALGNPNANPPKDADPSTYLSRAQKLLDKAAQLVDNNSKTHLSDIGALQLLVYQFQFRFAIEDSERDQLKGQIEKTLNDAVALNPDNPLLYVLVGTNMVRAGEKLSHVLSGRALLKEADRLFKARTISRSISTHFNEEWLAVFWLDFADKKLMSKVTS